jgi:uncharacterized membrane protein YkgB
MRLLRLSMAIVFLWFGLLKPLGLSPAEAMASHLVIQVTGVKALAHPLYLILAYMELLIGVLFLFERTTTWAVYLLFCQMPLTFMPMIFMPTLTFQKLPLVPSLEGQYILKNIVLIAVGWVLLKSQRTELKQAA